MKKYTKIIAWISICAFAIWFAFYTKAQNSQVSLSIIAWLNTYNVSGAINLGSHQSSFLPYSKEVVKGTFQTNTFVAQDLQWTAAWTLKIQSENLMAGTHKINSWNVFIKYASALVKTWGSGCSIDTDLTTTRVPLSTPINWLKKVTWDWTICKAAITPMIWVDIPASQAVGNYTAELTVTSAWAWAPGYTPALTY